MIEEKQIVKITPGGSWSSIEIGEIWRHRELLFFLAWRDVRVRYKQTAIGVAWAVLQPVLTTAIFTVLFSRFARFETGDVPYPLFALSGLVVWLFVHTAVTTASGAFVSNANLVTKVYFPRLIVPAASVAAGLPDLFFGLLILVALIIYYGVAFSAGMFLSVLFFALALILAAAVGVLFSALNVRFRDVKFALPFFLQVWMIASPVFYPLSILPARWQLVFAANPLTGVLDGLRSALFGTPFNWPVIGVSALALAVLIVVSLVVFSRMENDFADLI